MKEDVAELVRLYDDGSKASDKFGKLYSAIVPTRMPSAMSMPQITKTGPFGIPTFGYPTPEPEHERTVELLQSAKQYIDGWIKNVEDVLVRIGKTRYKMKFNDPRGSGVSNLSISELTENERKLDDILDDFGDRVAELRHIIFDYEESSERSLPTVTQVVEPARYDTKNRTIFFADEAIRFNKNAEYSPAICKLMFSKPHELWQLKDFHAVWDSLYDYLPDLQKPTDWNKVYDIIQKMNARVEKSTNISDLFKLTTKSVRLNPKYIAPSKK
ncbi:hypothetical protein KA047_00845 [Candidatus Saccharibacteria bacterium]|nr:hypothetical protein [Candidatus Saccharibacteria bacterium]